MAKKKAKQVGAVDWKKKRWYTIVAPRSLNETVLGETLADEATDLPGKTIKLSLMTVLGDLKKQSYWVKFQVTQLKDTKALTEFVSYEMSPSAVKRLVRRNRDRIDLSFVCATKDNKYVRIKPLVVTKSSTTRSVLSALRKKIEQFLFKEVTKYDSEALFNAIIRFKLQNDLRMAVGKIYPLRSCEIRRMVVLKALPAGKEIKMPEAEPAAEPVAQAAAEREEQ